MNINRYENSSTNGWVMDEQTRIQYDKVYIIIANGKSVNGDEWNGKAHLFHRIDIVDGGSLHWYGIEFENKETFDVIKMLLTSEE